MVRVAGERPVHKALGLVVAVLSIALLGGVNAASAHGSDRGGGPTISVLSGRADLVSGGDALISIGGLGSSRALSVQAGGKDQTSAFTHGSEGTLVGLVSGLPLGKSSVIVRAGRRAAKLRVTNHPIGGPIFSGPQLQPWKCQATALDAQCNQPATFSYVYKSSNPATPGFLPYDPANAPADVATTTTDRGRERSLHRAGRDRLPRSRPVPDRRPLPARASRGRRSRPSASSTTSCSSPTASLAARTIRPARRRRSSPVRPRPRSRAASRPCPTRSTTPATTATSRPRPSRW